MVQGCEFESLRRILDGHFFTLICCKRLNCLFEKTENDRKRGPFKKYFQRKFSMHHLLNIYLQTVGISILPVSTQVSHETASKRHKNF